MPNKGSIFVISAPSGGGKTSLVNALLEKLSNLKLSISYTTRQKRSSEEHTKNYYFVSEEEFEAMKQRNEFLEYATVFGNSYGTARQTVTEALQQGDDVVLEIDWQGAKQIKDNFPQAKMIFLLPPSIETLKERLHKRGSDDHVTIQKRLEQAEQEISQYGLFDYLVVNDDFDEALQQLISIITACGLTRERREAPLAQLIKDLTKK